jgi:uncharacterized membrane protein
MDINLSGLHGQSLTVIGRALVEIGEIQELERAEFRRNARQLSLFPETGAISGGGIAAQAEQTQVEEPAPAAEEKPAKKQRAAKAAAPAPTPSATEEAAPATPAPATASPSEPAVTLVDLRARLAELSRDGKADKVKALLSKFGVAKLTELEPTKFADVMAAAEGI